MRYAFSLVLLLNAVDASAADHADLILHNGKIVTVDERFSIAEAMAVQDGRITRIGTNDDAFSMQGDDTQVIDLAGKMVIPGLIDSHVHPNAAAMHEFDHEIPEMHTISDVLDYIKSRAAALEEGEWIVVRQVFITRLAEQRYPTRAELDAVAPKHPVMFSTGPDASLNSLALKLSGINKDFQVTGRGFAEKDPATGEPTGILRSCTRYVKVKESGRAPSEEDRYRRLRELLADYNSVGITAVADRNADAASVDRYRGLEKNQQLTVRIAVSRSVDIDGSADEVTRAIQEIGQDPLVKSDGMVRIVGIKTFLDGGMLTGSAYMREPWGVSQIYSITDPNYRGVLFIPRERLLPIVQAAADARLQFTAHSVGDGAVHTLLDVYDEVNSKTSIRDRRMCVTHSNFMSREAVEQAARLGVVLDIQPAWLYLDAKTLVDQFGDERLRYFQPLRTIFELGAIAGGGSDHMQKIGSLRSVNPYNPFLGMQTAITRRAKNLDRPLHPEEALSREQAIRFYTINNAHLIFREQEIGSLEPGKLADFAILDTDLLTCDENKIRDTKVLATYLAGRRVYAAQRDTGADATPN